MSRAGKEHTRRFPEFAAAIRALPPLTLILDGEVAIFDDRLVSRFEWFRKRPEDVAATPLVYMAFDCRNLSAPRRSAARSHARRAERVTAHRWLREPAVGSRTALLVLAMTIFAGCGSVPVPPTYTQDELKVICERHNGWWHPDELVGGYCERR